MRTNTAEYRRIQPLVIADIRAIVAATGSTSGAGNASVLAAHRLDDTAYHIGQLATSQAPWAVPYSVYSPHAANPDAHHATATAGNGISITGQQISLAATVAGAGLTHSAGVLAVGAGTLLTVAADTVGVSPGSAYQFIGTGSDTGAEWRNVSELAGNGLTAATGVLAVGVSGLGLGVGADAVTLTSSSNPGATASILASAASGGLTLVNLFASQGVQYTSFASGFAGSGWRADYGVTTVARASIETDDLTVRGRMRVYELLIQQIRATNGSVFVSSASKVVTASTSVNPLWTVNGSQLTFNGSNANLDFTLCTISTAAAGDTSRELYHGFLNGDIIRAQQVQWSGSEFNAIVQSDLEVTGVSGLFDYTAAFVAGDAPATGYDYVRLGNAIDSSRRGSVYLTADDSAAPFIDIVDGVRFHSDWNSAGVRRARVGKLSGISDSDLGGTLSGYGLYGNNVYLKGQIVVTGGDLGGLAAADVNANTTTIDGGKITANSITAGQITAGTITATQIAAGTITADKLTVSTLSAITANMGSLTAGSIVIGSANKIWLNDSTDGALNIGGATKASAPFQVSAAGALTATNATVTGAITASSGSIAGFLTIGASGGIYQGSGTSGTPTTGLKIWNSGGTGRIAGYNAGAVQFDIATDGMAYFGANNIRLASDGQRLVLPSSSSLNISTSTAAIRWFPAIDSTPGVGMDFAGQVAYINTSGGGNVLDGLFTSYVGSTNYTTRAARIGMQAGHSDGTTYTDAYLLIVREAGSGKRYGIFAGDEFNFDSTVWLKSQSAHPTVSTGENRVYVKGSYFVIAYNNGGATKYRYLTLTSTNADWTYSTTAP